MIDTKSAKQTKPAPMSRQRKQLILNFIHEYRTIKSISPTYEEIAVGIGYSATAEGTAYTLVNELVNEGWLNRIGGARSLVPVYPVEEIYCEITDSNLKAVRKRQHKLKILRRL